MVRLAKTMALVVAVALVPGALAVVTLRQRATEQQSIDQALSTHAYAEATQIGTLVDKANTTGVLLAKNDLFHQYFRLQLQADKVGWTTELEERNLALRAQMTDLFGVLGTTVYDNGLGAVSGIEFGNSCAESQVAPSTIHGCANQFERVVDGIEANFALQTYAKDESKESWFAPTRALGLYRVYEGKPIRSTDTNQWVIPFSTLIPPSNTDPSASVEELSRKAPGMLYFEVALESLRKAAAKAVAHARVNGLTVAIVDAQGNEILRSDTAVATAAHPLASTNGQFASLIGMVHGSRQTSGSADVGGKRAYWISLHSGATSANDWTVLAVANPVRSVLSASAIPIAVGLALLLIVAFLMGRRWVSTSDQALTDPLTGLKNRRKLSEDLKHLVEPGRPEHLLALFDLDGFKNYNDNFGHPAGDALLARLGRRLGEVTEALGGRAYRLGGDEFCIVCELDAEGQTAILAAACDALSESGEGFTVGTSFGSVVVPTETQEESAAMHIADKRLYANKTSGRRSAGRQATDALARALENRIPELSDHIAGVVALALRTGERLGVGGQELDQLREVAELHDIGMMAVPDSIIKTLTPLSQEDWEFIRGHTVVGERIVAAAPSLAHVAKIIRATHERFGGSGYPDGLVGDAIPIEARIVAVCDAYDAMIGPRPHRLGMTSDAALEELRSCAGTQFDPVIVDVFCAVIAEQALEQQAEPARL
jgi:diguanylate cyclase (GGDEF)-like protein